MTIFIFYTECVQVERATPNWNKFSKKSVVYGNKLNKKVMYQVQDL